MAHAYKPHHQLHMEPPFAGKSPLTAWSANGAQLHTDKMNGYPCYVLAGAQKGCCAVVDAVPTGGVLQNGFQVAGVKRKWRELPSEDSSATPLCHIDNSKRVCMREHHVSEARMDYASNGHTALSPDLPTPMDTVSITTTTPCSNFHHKKYQLYTLSEVGMGCHHSQLGLSIIDCPRCLAGEPGHLEHVLHPQEHMDT